ncbi:MAG TPA: TlpA family protein disulfide reductase [Anaerolineae bacterium]|nr:TlpA family protein disulfide reductase [Anaerolineae bacterium]
MHAKRSLAGLILATLFLGGLWIWWARVPAGVAAIPSQNIPLKGHPAPDFTLQTPEGESLSLADLRGKAVVLNFWATWCPPCRAEMPELQAAWEAYGAGGLVVLGVNQAEDAATVQAYLDELGLTFPVVLDTQYEAASLYSVNSLPTTYFIDREGIIRDFVVGQMNAALLSERIKTIYP